MSENDFNRLKGCYKLGKIYTFDLVIKAIRLGRVPEEKEEFLAFENTFTKEEQ